MSRRIDVELTSDRGDGTWTWRAAGAKQPKGEVDGGLLPSGASAGDVLSAEADFDIDGITIMSVAQPKRASRAEPELLEILGSGTVVPDVTTTWVERKGRGDKGKGRGKDDRNRGGGRGGRGDSGDRGGRGDRSRGRSGGHTPPPPERPKKPKAPRLRTKRTHRDALLAELTDAERPVAEQALKGGIAAVREALKTQNAENEEAGKPAVPSDAVVGMAEKLLPRLKAADWRDRAEAAVAQMEKVDLRDLRSVVTASDGAARDDETRALAEQVRTGMLARVESDHNSWLQEVAETLADGRVARALNLSSRPPKAGAPLPRDMAERLAAAASSSLTTEVGQKRWQTVLESVARSPVRQSVVPEGIPSSPNDELLETVRNLSMQMPQIAAAFDIEPQRPKRKRRRSGKGKGESNGPKTPAATAPAKSAAAPRIPPPPDLSAESTDGASAVDDAHTETVTAEVSEEATASTPNGEVVAAPAAPVAPEPVATEPAAVAADEPTPGADDDAAENAADAGAAGADDSEE